ncbi:efflux RND transporter periplasmic adaptor subunit [Ottowia sp. SB7-C50]|uniref:efflux RND transporter periplasmic adaptor subunit n=1 Tax=Ottowia sp. SB7-C50 TaxID=3081231 RepID=UPI0029540E3E|nr:efflux RND transporter periplasmic adaptor subunit [Ottowia sp. SB7-C50]WOP14313.1 efflux RND transporter periplasmic adaptor subunit [Ottowia sp. SB7-C50]
MTQVVLRPQVSGVLTEVLFTEGQTVQKGQLLARIDPRPFEQALTQAQGERARIQAQLSAARVTLGRYETLWKQDSIARQDVDTQAALVKQLEGQVQSATASEGNARINLGYARITAPIAGRIGLRAVDPGNMVQAGATTGIATLTQMTPIDVKFAVPQDRVPEVLAAQRTGALPVQALGGTREDVLAAGRFLTLDNVIDTATGTLQAKARFDNAQGQLFPNQFVNVRLQLGATPGVLVPVTAVRTGPDGDYVYVVDAERVAHMRPVKRGGATVDEVLVTSGVQAGETVITEGGDRVKDGGRVSLAGERPMGRASGAPGARGPRGGGQRCARGRRRAARQRCRAGPAPCLGRTGCGPGPGKGIAARTAAGGTVRVGARRARQWRLAAAAAARTAREGAGHAARRTPHLPGDAARATPCARGAAGRAVSRHGRRRA